jgi:hypothetical protein
MPTMSVPASTTSVPLFTAATPLDGRSVFNDSTSVLYLKFGAVASTSDYTVQIAAGGYFEFPPPLYMGEVDGIWASANGNARLTSW